MKIFGYTPAQVRKFLIAALGFLLTVVAAFLEGGLIPNEWLPYVLIFIGVCASYGVFKKSNAPSGKHVDLDRGVL